ncbi:TonB-dependent receptor [Steroidobacter agaridevorans]|uniref:TonB-dependent receptor n=1 Tax=Steroidobacter agaridevorans TaxID=2695856 RepID=A0A829YL27_9GAMM|nr:TonB-dependent receptor [Steroidobacter agaridevorans]GFE83551.1 TonB-dependent receptor [Steroidobacter agaridevorans]
MTALSAPLGLAIAIYSIATTGSALAAEDNVIIRDPTFEQLARLTVTSVTGTVRPQFTSPAATYVLTAEELNYVGVRNIPEALRYAPGMQVSQFDAARWSISARGFNTIAVDKLLVLVDGRPVYTPLWSGVYWEQHAWLSQDLDRIETINGPAGSVWGANAMNGVVNILSHSARDTQGTALTVGTGTEEKAFGSFRYGGAAGENAWYRAYVDYTRRDDTELGNRQPTGDAWDMGRVGFRYDRDDDANRIFVKAEAQSGDFDEAGFIPSPTPPYQTRPPRGYNRGGFVQGSWAHRLREGAEVAAGAWYERLERRLQPTDEHSDTFDIGVRYGTQLGGMHSITAGALYRYIKHETASTFQLTFTPPNRTLHQWSAYLQDEIRIDDRLGATLGLRVEDNPFTGLEWQPDLRLNWSVTDRQLLWAAVGRAVRTPTFADESRTFVTRVSPPGSFGPGSPAVLNQVLGDPDLESEDLIAYQLGWRGRWHDNAMLSASVFYNDYDRLILYAPQPLDTVTLAPDFWRMAVAPVNSGTAHGHGAELAGMWQPMPRWRLFGTASYLDLDVHPAELQLATNIAGSTAQVQASLRSNLDLGNDWELGVGLRYVDDLPALNVDSYVGAEVRVAKELTEGVKLALVGQNLWEPRHAEFRSASFPIDPYIERSVYLALSWRR